MDYNLEQALRRINRGTSLRIWGKFGSSNETLEKGDLVSIDFNNGTLVLHNTTYDSNREILCGQITCIETGSGYTTLYPAEFPEGGLKVDPGLAEIVRNIPFGTYLMITGDFGDAINYTIRQGTLKSIDWDNGIIVLYTDTYKQDVTVPMDKIIFIDDSRVGPGALHAVQDSDWKRDKDGNWYKINTSNEVVRDPLA